MNRIGKISITFFSLLLIVFSSAHAQSDKELNILSWNIYMLPGIANLSKSIDKSDKKARAEHIANYLNESEHDVVVFQEAFFNPARRVLSKGIKEVYPYQYGPINPSKMSMKTSSGIFIVSKTPLKLLGTTQYEACNGADCFAKKGAALFEGEFDGKKYQILGTHLNAGGPQWIREEQYKKIKALLESFDNLGIPQIVCGDMNTHKEEQDKYENMLSVLDVEDIPTTSKQINTTAKDRTVIDYIFLRRNNTSIKALNKDVLWINPENFPVIDKLNNNLSDHLAISATFTW